MYRALSAAVILGLFAAPAFANIHGATCTTSDPYLPGGTATMCWTCTNGSPTAPDPEGLDKIALGYPDGWTVACSSQDATDSGGVPVAFSCSAIGQTVTYADSDGGPGEILPGRSWSFCVRVTAPATATTPKCAFYTLSGDGSGGEPHNVIDCGTCLPAQGSVTIVKQTVPVDAGGRLFAFAGDLGAISLTGGQSSTISDLGPGTYHVTEALPAGWKLTGITCVDPDNGSTSNLATSTASIDVDWGEHITCTFLNTEQGSVTIAKQTVPQDAGGQTFAFAGGLGAFSLTGGQSSTIPDLAPGTYTVTETSPAGWQLTGITCVDPDGGSTFSLPTSSASIDLDAGEHITCTFLNTEQGSVTIAKQTVPEDAGGQLFAFAGGLGGFSLTGGQSSTVPNLAPGTYAVTEALPAGWQLTGITCVDPDGGSTFSLSTSTASIDLDAGEHVTCTFINSAQGSVTIVKQTVPVDAGGQLFAFAGGLGAFSLTGGQSSTIPDLAPGTYAVTETSPAGWQLTGITCVDPDGGSTFSLPTSTASIDLDAGEHVTCTFINTAQGSVTIVKQTVPEDAGGQLFAFAGGLGAFSLTGGQSSTIPDLAPGTYAVTETLPAGWKLTGITCVDPDGGSTFSLPTSTASIDLDAGEHVTCTFLNTAQGSVTIVKQTVPQDAGGQTFAFAGGLGAFSLTGGQSSTIPDLAPGTYAVTEALPAGWQLTGITCVDPDGGSTFDLATFTASIDLDAGEHVTCTFLNTEQGSVTIVKQTVPQDAGGQTFAFAGGLGAFSLTGGQSSTISDLAPGTYDVSETEPAGWQLTQITCVDPDGGSTFNLATFTASIDLDAGEHVTCTFLNTATETSVTIVKQTLPQNAGGQMFAFAGDLGVFSLTGGESTTASGMEPGTYTVTEGTLPPGWQLIEISCVDPDGGSTSNLATSSATIDLDAGEQVTCTFLNRSDDYVPPPGIPTLSTWMLLLLAGLLSVLGVLVIRSRIAG